MSVSYFSSSFVCDSTMADLKWIGEKIMRVMFETDARMTLNTWHIFAKNSEHLILFTQFSIECAEKWMIGWQYQRQYNREFGTRGHSKWFNISTVSRIAMQKWLIKFAKRKNMFCIFSFPVQRMKAGQMMSKKPSSGHFMGYKSWIFGCWPKK